MAGHRGPTMRYLYALITIGALLALRGEVHADVPMAVDVLFVLVLIAAPLAIIRRRLKRGP